LESDLTASVVKYEIAPALPGVFYAALFQLILIRVIEVGFIQPPAKKLIQWIAGTNAALITAGSPRLCRGID
jgi:hypothetical protein